MTTFGVVIDPDAPMPELVERARIAERLGFDTITYPTTPAPGAAIRVPVESGSTGGP